jgi:RimJ/RimL family protein N-acetyltransferase
MGDNLWNLFDILKLNRIYAGSYPHNIASQKMLAKCGFKPHPEGNLEEKHYLTGEPIIQYDYVKLIDDYKAETTFMISGE